VTAKTQTISSYFDPEVEFLEIGVKVNNDPTSWKAYGPDKDETYGGLQGIGGLEAIITPTKTYSIVHDILGHVVATHDGTETKRAPTQVGSYGPLPGSLALSLTAERGLHETTHWLGKRLDETGLIWIGARYYNPQSGTWLSSDPFGHVGSWDLYSLANGDPVNYTDPDGRLSKGFNSGFASGSTDSTQSWAYNAGVVAGKIDRPIADTINHPMFDAIPVAGMGKTLAQSLTGYDFLNRPLTGSERAGSIVSTGMGAIPVGVLVKTGAAIGKQSAKALSNAAAAKETTTVIGRVKDLQTLAPGERSLLDRLPDLGSPKLNWQQNSGVLRQEMNRGFPIRDASVGDTSGQFLNAERNLLRDRGWTFDANTNLWNPPVP